MRSLNTNVHLRICVSAFSNTRHMSGVFVDLKKNENKKKCYFFFLTAQTGQLHNHLVNCYEITLQFHNRLWAKQLEKKLLIDKASAVPWYPTELFLGNDETES